MAGRIRTAHDKARDREHKKALRLENPEYFRAQKRASRKRHPETGKEWRLRNPERAKELKREWYRKHPEKGRLAALRRHFGVDAIEYRTAMLAAQKNLCGICERPSDQCHQELGLDHDHRFDKKNAQGWRGFLCSNCNFGLGHFRDDPTVLARAIAYLDRWRKP